MIVTIDAGHSGPVEPGACAGGVCECNVTLGIALQLAALIREDGHTVYLLRESDIDDTDTDGLAWRANASNDAGSDAYLCIHANSAANEAARGTEVYCYPGSEDGHTLADCIRCRMVAALGTVDRGTKEANFEVLRLTAAPAVLIETAFLSNPDDRALLLPSHYYAIAAAIKQGFADWAGVQ